MVHRYSRWDGTQHVDLITSADAMERIADELLDDGDLRTALRRMLQRGFQTPDGRRMMGLQELLERLRAARSRNLQRYNLEPMLDDIKARLDGIVNAERQALQQRLRDRPSASAGQDAPPSGDGQPDGQGQEGGAPTGQAQSGQNPQGHAVRQAMQDLMRRRMERLSQLPPDVGGRIQQLREYDFVDPGARQQFEELMQMLQQQVMQSYFQGLQRGIQSMTPEALRQVQQMVRDLNRMLQQRQRGEQPDFQGFMQQWGQMFPQGINSLDDLIQHLRGQMAAMESLVRSMSPEQRQQLDSMMQALLQDHGLRADLAQLAANLGRLMPQRGASGDFDFTGDEPLTLQEALRLMGELNSMDGLERQLLQAFRNNDASRLDADEIGRLLGEEARQTAEQLQRFTRMLEEAGLLQRDGDEWALTAKALRKIGERALQDIFGKLREGMFGAHNLDKRGVGVELLDETRPFQFGDAFSVDVQKSVMNAVVRGGQHTPVKLDIRDFEVQQTGARTECSTVIALDMSYSMMMNGCFQAARKVALALDTLIRSKFPRDNLYVVAFSYFVLTLKAQMLLNSHWVEYGGGTNVQEGLRQSRRILRKHKLGTKQVILITDAQPTTYTRDDGQVVGWGRYRPTPDVLAATLREVAQCTKENITINTFMMAPADRTLTEFVRMMAKLNNGRLLHQPRPDRPVRAC
ncbi:MAG: VWA domain-containing protein [SAR202 cluster bacterium]|nr:VWA domain-containing protein [SAR202 cluster bacterium]